MLILNIQPFKIGIQEMNMEKVEFIILLQSEGCVPEQILKFHGHKSKLAQQLHGNIQVVY